MSESPIFDLIQKDRGVEDGVAARAAVVISDALGPGSALLSARIAESLRAAGVLARDTALPEPDTHEQHGTARVPYWFTPAGTVSALEYDDTIRCDIDGNEVALELAHAEDTAHAVLAAVRHLRGLNDGK